MASLVWDRLGNVPYYVEPFFGSGAVLLGRPHAGCSECVNDLDCMITNFWRSVAADPEAVASAADWPVSEPDLVARHRWLVARKPEISRRILEDAEFFDARAAGWWVWGFCQWIGSGWCRLPGEHQEGDKRPRLDRGAGLGIHSRHGRGGISTEGRGLLKKASFGLPETGGLVLRSSSYIRKGVLQQSRPLLEWMMELASRLRTVRVLCGDFERVLTKGSTVDRWSVVGVFLDPPYDRKRRRGHLYNEDGAAVADRAREWCATAGTGARYRIALCGLAGEHSELEQLGWFREEWTRSSGMSRGTEAIWFSPGCLRQASLFETTAPEEEVHLEAVGETSVAAAG